LVAEELMDARKIYMPSRRGVNRTYGLRVYNTLGRFGQCAHVMYAYQKRQIQIPHITKKGEKKSYMPVRRVLGNREGGKQHMHMASAAYERCGGCGGHEP